MWSRIAVIYLLILLSSCGLEYKSDISLRGGNSIGGSLGLEIAGNLTSVDVNEGSSLVIVPTLTGVSTKDIDITVTVSSVRNDVADFFPQTLPLRATIPAGGSNTTFTINTTHDVTYTGDLPFVVTVSSPDLSGSVVLNLILKDNEPLVLGSFSIDGVRDSLNSSDTTLDTLLLDSQTPGLTWGTSSWAASYDVSILDDDGTTIRCATQNTTQTQLNFSNVSCILNYGSFYRAKVTARNGVVVLDAPLVRFEVKSSAILTSDIVLMANNGGPITFDPRLNDLDTGTTITGVSTPTRGSASFTANTVTYTRANNTPGVVTFNYTAIDGNGDSRDGTVTVRIVAPYSWTGAVSNNFATPGNWCGTVSTPGLGGTCNGHTVAPSSSTHAYIDLTCSSANCSPQINANQTLQGLSISGNSLSMVGSATLRVETGGFNLAAGSFTGATGEVYVQDSNLRITGGTFTAPSTTLRFRRWEFEVASGAVFNHNNGTLVVEGNWDREVVINASSSTVFNNVDLNPNGTTFLNRVIGTMVVNGNLTMNHIETGSTYNEIVAGTIQVRGNVTTNGNGLRGSGLIEIAGNPLGQTITGTASGSGSYVPGLRIAAGTNPVTLSGNVKVGDGLYNLVSSGTFTTTGSTLALGNAGCGFKEYVLGNARYNNLMLAEGCQGFDFLGGTVRVDGNLIMRDFDFSKEMRNGVIEVRGNYENLNTSYGITNSQNLTVRMVGNSGGQTVSSVGTMRLPGLTIDTGSYNVTMSGNIILYDHFLIESVGTFTAPSQLTFEAGCEGYGSDGFQAKMKNLNFNNLRLNGQCTTYDFGGETGNVTNLVVNSENRGNFNNGTLHVSGDLSLIGDDGLRGSATVVMTGNASGQTINVNGAYNTPYIPRLVIDAGSNQISVTGSQPLTVATYYEHISSGAMNFTATPFILGLEDCIDMTARMGSITYNNVSINTACHDTYLTSSVSIAGNLNFLGGWAPRPVHMPNPGTGYFLNVGGVFDRNSIPLNAYGATVNGVVEP